ncbi:MAG: NAD(P)/FAD-dependent oxidoreductase [Clostridia bacterium]
MKDYDVLVIGGGVVGCAIADSLTENSVKVALVEKSADVANVGATKANSGIVHAGFDCHPGTLKAKLNVLGSQMFPKICERLGVELINCGAIVVGKKDDYDKIKKLYDQGIENGVEGLSIIERGEILKYAPNAAADIEFALLAKSSSIISPYLVTIAFAEEAKINGCDFYFDSEVSAIEKKDGKFIVTCGSEKIQAKAVINASGASANDINKLAGAEEFPLRFARGEYMLLDLTEKGFVNCTMFPLPTALGKGVLVSPTVHGNIIVGPTAIDCQADENVISFEGLDYIRENANAMLCNVNYRKNIRVFAGNRSISGEDFVIETSKNVDNFIYLGGICSPGLSSSPAIAEYVTEMVGNLGFKLAKKDMKKRTPYNITSEMSETELNKLIAKDGRFGKIVCRCEKITEGEIVEAVNSPLRPKTVDGVKRRVRAGMGRCQGGFCMPRVMEIIARENGMKIEDVTKFGQGSDILLKGEN